METIVVNITKFFIDLPEELKISALLIILYVLTKYIFIPWNKNINNINELNNLIKSLSENIYEINNILKDGNDENIKIFEDNHNNMSENIKKIEEKIDKLNDLSKKLDDIKDMLKANEEKNDENYKNIKSDILNIEKDNVRIITKLEPLLEILKGIR